MAQPRNCPEHEVGLIFGSAASRYLKKYRAGELIAEGFFGRVCKAVRQIDEKDVAVKTGFNYDSGLFRELATLEYLGSEGPQKYIQEILDIARDPRNGWPAIVYPLADSDLLRWATEGFGREIQNRDGVLTEITIQLFTAMEFLKDMRVIHGDIKAENVLVDIPHGCIKLTDFGLSCQTAEPIVGCDELNHVGISLPNYAEVFNATDTMVSAWLGRTARRTDLGGLLQRAELMEEQGGKGLAALGMLCDGKSYLRRIFYAYKVNPFWLVNLRAADAPLVEATMALLDHDLSTPSLAGQPVPENLRPIIHSGYLLDDAESFDVTRLKRRYEAIVTWEDRQHYRILISMGENQMPE